MTKLRVEEGRKFLKIENGDTGRVYKIYLDSVTFFELGPKIWEKYGPVEKHEYLKLELNNGKSFTFDNQKDIEYILENID